MHASRKASRAEFACRNIPTVLRCDLVFGVLTQARKEGRLPHVSTFGLADHHVAELALPTFVKALHLNVIGGFRLQVTNRVPLL